MTSLWVGGRVTSLWGALDDGLAGSRGERLDASLGLSDV